MRIGMSSSIGCCKDGDDSVTACRSYCSSIAVAIAVAVDVEADSSETRKTTTKQVDSPPAMNILSDTLFYPHAIHIIPGEPPIPDMKRIIRHF